MLAEIKRFFQRKGAAPVETKIVKAVTSAAPGPQSGLTPTRISSSVSGSYSARRCASAR